MKKPNYNFQFPEKYESVVREMIREKIPFFVWYASNSIGFVRLGEYMIELDVNGKVKKKKIHHSSREMLKLAKSVFRSKQGWGIVLWMNLVDLPEEEAEQFRNFYPYFETYEWSDGVWVDGERNVLYWQ